MTKYILPFPDYIEKKIAKPSGKYAHENFPESKYAVDFLLDEGTRVLAIHDGTVLKVKSDSDKYFNPKDIVDLEISEVRKLAEKYTNYVCIDHEDGTFAEYLHLGKDKVYVKERQKIKQGELIGCVGYSGVMSEPHLHLNVFRFVKSKAESIEIKFESFSPCQELGVYTRGQKLNVFRSLQNIIKDKIY